MEDFERELRQALVRLPAPPSLKRKVLERRDRQRAGQTRLPALWLERVAAVLLLAALLGGALFRHNAEQRRKGEAARQQVFTALRIAGHALDEMNTQLTARNPDQQ